MGRLFWPPFNFVAGVSLALALVTSVAWVRSYFVAERLTWYRQVGDRAAHRVEAVRVVSADGVVAWNLQRQRFEDGELREGLTAEWTFGYSSYPEIRAGRVMSLKLMDVRSVGALGVRFSHYFRRGPTGLRSGENGADAWVTVLPYGWAFGAAVVLPGVAGARWGVRGRRRRAARAGMCAGCGYDLRATPGRCPECGREAVRDEPG